MRIVEAKGPPEQQNEQTCGQEPRGAGDREHQPYRHFGGEQSYDRPDQRALGEAEMIVDEEVDVGNVRWKPDLVEKYPDENRRVDGEHQPPGVFSQTQIHSAPDGLAWVPTITGQVLRLARDEARSSQLNPSS